MFKPISMSDSVSFVSTYDPAVDRAAICDREIEKHPEWLEDHMSTEQMRELAWLRFQSDFGLACSRDPSESVKMLLFKDGETPTKFVIGAMASEDFNRVIDETQETSTWRGATTQRFWRMFLHGLRGIENWSGKVETRKVGDIEYVDPAWLRKTFVRDLRQVAIQVGTVIMSYNSLTEEEIKN